MRAISRIFLVATAITVLTRFVFGWPQEPHLSCVDNGQALVYCVSPSCSLEPPPTGQHMSDLFNRSTPPNKTAAGNGGRARENSGPSVLSPTFQSDIPAISSISKLSSPFRLKILGSGFQQGMAVFIDGQAWKDVVVSSTNKVVMRGGPSLKAQFPIGTFVRIVLVNPDGGRGAVGYDRGSGQWVVSCSWSCSAVVPSAADVGQVVPFQAEIAEQNCSASPTFEWDFGDGTTHGVAPDESHVYSSAGTFSWRLLVTLGADTYVGQGTISVGLSACTIWCATTMPWAVQTNKSFVAWVNVQGFEGDACQPITDQPTYVWDYGDGTIRVGGSWMHSYGQPGQYQAHFEASYRDARYNKDYPVTVSENGLGQWTSTGSLVNPRAGHTATVLPNGKVLVVGGTGADGKTVASAELFDPLDGTWTATAGLQQARAFHTATLLMDGRVLVAGGGRTEGQGEYYLLDSVEIYDSRTGHWTSTQKLPSKRYMHTANLLPSGKVLVVGGRTVDSMGNIGTTKVCISYNPLPGSWAAVDSLDDARNRHTATSLEDGSILVLGGFGQTGDTLYTAERFDPITAKWGGAGGPRMWGGTGSVGHIAALLPSGQVLVAGGCSGTPAGCYTHTFSELFSVPWNYRVVDSQVAASLSGQVAVLPDGKILAFGWDASCLLYNPTVENWGLTCSMNASMRNGGTLTVLQDGRVLATGGRDLQDNVLATAELFTY